MPPDKLNTRITALSTTAEIYRALSACSKLALTYVHSSFLEFLDYLISDRHIISDRLFLITDVQKTNIRFGISKNRTVQKFDIRSDDIPI